MMQQQKEYYNIYLLLNYREMQFRNLTNWTAKATAFKPKQYYVRQQRELDEEVEFTNKDIKATRNRKLKALYDEDMVQWEQELNARGLSMTKDWA